MGGDSDEREGDRTWCAYALTLVFWHGRVVVLGGRGSFGGKMKVERKTRRLVLARTTLRLLSPQQLKVVAGVNSVWTETVAQDSYRECVDDLTNTHLHC